VGGDLTNIAVVLAGGTGQRIGSPMPKQLIEIGGRPILAYSVDAFARHPDIDMLVVVMAPGFLASAEEIARPYGKVRAVVEGGATRSESTVRALAALAGRPDDARVLFHDAARPFVDSEIIDRCLAALGRYEAVAVAQPVSDTIVAVSDEGMVEAMPSRATLRRFQTPQGFRLGTIRKAYELATADPGFAATDDCGVVHRYLPDVPIPVVAGSERNLKVTHPLDIAIAEHLCGG
jgi:2-C-methyl-D-erythritol 4-phosphate cytidylyltransferase